MTLRVGINGFGRTGRQFFRAWWENHRDSFDIVAINGRTPVEMHTHLLRYDSDYGRFPAKIEDGKDSFAVEGREVKVFTGDDPATVPWADAQVDVVVESTGEFTDRASAALHLRDGVKKVLLSAPGKGEDWMVILGVTDEQYDPSKHHIISPGSCTTNCVVPMVKVLHDAFGIERGFMTTIHAYTADQNIQDGPHKDLRRARAAAHSIVPTTTGAAVAATLALPQLEGKLDGSALRVPVIDGSITDFVATVGREVSVDEVNDAFRSAAESGPLAGVLDYTDHPVVSTDIIHNPHSCIFDSLSTMVMGNQVKVFGWYDNEWGYSCRLVDFTQYVAERM